MYRQYKLDIMSLIQASFCSHLVQINLALKVSHWDHYSILHLHHMGRQMAKVSHVILVQWNRIRTKTKGHPILIVDE